MKDNLSLIYIQFENKSKGVLVLLKDFPTKLYKQRAQLGHWTRNFQVKKLESCEEFQAVRAFNLEALKQLEIILKACKIKYQTLATKFLEGRIRGYFL